MIALKHSARGLASAAVLALLPLTPAAAAGPLLFAPLALRHVLGAVARLATLPLMAAAQVPAPAAYPPASAYAAAPGGYYPQGPAYYPPPPTYYRPAPVYGYAPAMPRYYGPPRGDYAPYARYAGSHAPHYAYRSGGFGYRRR
jgi:hypothetical protein